ncbi:MAG: nuclease-related domain-containing protein, partial [Cyanobacteria bacterium J06559_1]
SEWWRWYANVPPKPVHITIFCGLLFTYSIFRLLPLRRKIKTLKMARDGEKAVGQYLERLRADGYQVFHDVVGKNFNIDHVIIGENGIFTIETKTYRKPTKGRANIHFDGESITANGYKLDRNPVVQSLAQAGWLSTPAG